MTLQVLRVRKETLDPAVWKVHAVTPVSRANMGDVVVSALRAPTGLTAHRDPRVLLAQLDPVDRTDGEERQVQWDPRVRWDRSDRGATLERTAVLASQEKAELLVCQERSVYVALGVGLAPAEISATLAHRARVALRATRAHRALPAKPETEASRERRVLRVTQAPTANLVCQDRLVRKANMERREQRVSVAWRASRARKD